VDIKIARLGVDVVRAGEDQVAVGRVEGGVFVVPALDDHAGGDRALVDALDGEGWWRARRPR
jgi:hypothetical protein